VTVVDVSVIVVTHNNEGSVSACLDSVARECRDLRPEIFVVDSGSSDRTVEIVRRRPDVSLRVSGENIGFSAGNNLALRECRGRYVLLLNPDTVVHDGALQTLIEHMGTGRQIAAVGPTLLLESGEVQPESARNLPRLGNLLPWLLLLDKLEWALRFRRRPRSSASHPPPGTLLDRFTLLAWSRDRTCAVEALCGACILLRREAIQAVGLLDESQPLYLDDIDYCRRLRDAGWSLHFVPDARITHLWQHSSTGLDRDGDFYAMGCHAIWLFLRKHEGVLAGMVFSGMACAAAPVRLLTCVVAGALASAHRRAFWRRQRSMALGLLRWAYRWPKRAPRFGFASETKPAAAAPPAALPRSP